MRKPNCLAVQSYLKEAWSHYEESVIRRWGEYQGEPDYKLVIKPKYNYFADDIQEIAHAVEKHDIKRCRIDIKAKSLTSKFPERPFEIEVW